jgi:LacI family transcriptional regulator
VKRKPTVYDIAERAKVSASTVSRVLNNSSLVSDDAREVVNRAAEAMGYRKRDIRRHRARAILNVALVLPYGNSNHLHLFYDAADLIHAVSAGFQDVQANIIAVADGPSVRIFQNKKIGEIDACVFAFASPGKELLRTIDERDIPVVLINRIDPAHNYVVSDHAAGMALLLGELVAHVPDVRPYYLGFPEIPQVSDLRKEGLIAAAAERSVPFNGGDVFDLGSLHEITPALIERILNNGYNAILSFNDMVAVYVYQCALSMGLRIPRDFSLTGFDNSPVRDLVSEPIVSVDLDVPNLGFETGRWLRDAIIEKRHGTLHLHVPGHLIPGTTVGITSTKGDEHDQH